MSSSVQLVEEARVDLSDGMDCLTIDVLANAGNGDAAIIAEVVIRTELKIDRDAINLVCSIGKLRLLLSRIKL